MNIELLAKIVLAGLCIVAPLAVAFVWSLCRAASDIEAVREDTGEYGE